jgi:D-alanyl-D-alanine dipeptidase
LNLSLVQNRAKTLGMSLKVYECYRPQSANDEIVAWAKDLDDDSMRMEFFPGFTKTELHKHIGHKSAHSRGSAVDLTLITLPLG